MSESNVFRPVYRELEDEEKQLVDGIKNAAQSLYNRIDQAKDCREKSMAKTKLEESIMWVVKGITS